MAQTIVELIGKHHGADAFVCGTGTSLADFDWRRLNGKLSIALNDAVLAKGYRPTYHLFADDHLHQRYTSWYEETAVIVPHITAHLLNPAAPRHYRFTQIEDYSRMLAKEADPRWPEPYGHLRMPEIAVTPDGDDLYLMHTVAIAGIQFAWKLGASRIYLLGCDAYIKDKKTYWDHRRSALEFDTHLPVDLGDGRVRISKHIYWDMEMHNLRDWLTRIHWMNGSDQTGVWNCSRLSTLTAWPKIDLDTILD